MVVTALILKGKHNNIAIDENNEYVVTALILKGKHNTLYKINIIMQL